MNEKQKKAIGTRNYLVTALELVTRAEGEAQKVGDPELTKNIIECRHKLNKAVDTLNSKLEDKF